MPKRDHWMAPSMGKSSSNPEEREERWVVKDREAEFNLIGSTVGADAGPEVSPEQSFYNCEGAVHMPVLDIDHMCHLYESETPGHFHLYIDVPMTWDQYAGILKAFQEAGVLERGYVSASLSRRCTYVSPKPWKEKQ